MASRSPASTALSPEPEGARKRRRTALACDECRDRKRKCDGVKPICGACSRRSATSCIWNEDRINRTWSNSYVEELRSRIRDLEKAQESIGNVGPVEETQLPSPTRVSPGSAIPSIHTMEPPVSVRPLPPQEVIDPAINTYYPEIGITASSITVNSFSDSGSMGATADQVFSFDSSRRADSPLRGAREDSFDVFGSDRGSTGMDAMGVVGSVEESGGAHPRARRESDYFGPSSTMALLSKARKVMGRRCCGHGPLLSTGSEPCTSCRDDVVSSSSTYRTPSTRDSGFQTGSSNFDLSLPPRREADSLLESYWKWCQALYPFLHRPSFSARYRTIWNGPMDSQVQDTENSKRQATDFYDHLSDRSFYCLLNVVFALGALSNLQIGERSRDSISRSFFERAKKLLDLDLLAQGSTGLVQMLLLMGQYLQTTDMSSSCWNIVGLAIRVAQCIGLHHEPRECDRGCCPKGDHDQLDTDMRRRTWTGCVLLDRVLSLTYGRPLMIHPTTTQRQLILPSATDDQYLTRFPDPPGSQPEGTPSMTECYVQAVKLQDILGQVLAAFYYAAPDHRHEGRGHFDLGLNTATAAVIGDGMMASDFQMLLDSDTILTAWHKRLPTHLRVETYRTPDTSRFVDPGWSKVFHRQAVVLEARYLHVRLTMLRPVLSMLCDSRRSGTVTPDDDSIESNMRQGMLFKAAKLCLSMAQDIVNLLTRAAKLGAEYCPPPWYNVFYIHSSAMVLLLGHLVSLNYPDIMDRESLVNGVDRCIAFLRSYESQSHSAPKCRKILELVELEVFRGRNGNGTTASSTAGSHVVQGRAPTSIGLGDTGTKHNQRVELDPVSRNEEVFPPHLFHENGYVDQGWMWNPSDMAYLSYMPFLDDPGSGGTV